MNKCRCNCNPYCGCECHKSTPLNDARYPLYVAHGNKNHLASEPCEECKRDEASLKQPPVEDIENLIANAEYLGSPGAEAMADNVRFVELILLVQKFPDAIRTIEREARDEERKRIVKKLNNLPDAIAKITSIDK